MNKKIHLCIPVSWRAPLCRLAARRGTTLSQRGRCFTANPSPSRLRSSRLGRARSRCTGRTSSGAGCVPKPEQKGRKGTKIRQIRSPLIRHQRDAPRRRRHLGQHLPDRPSTTEETILTEDRAARQALQTILPYRQDQGSRRERFRVGPRQSYLFGMGIFATFAWTQGENWNRVKIVGRKIRRWNPRYESLNLGNIVDY